MKKLMNLTILVLTLCITFVFLIPTTAQAGTNRKQSGYVRPELCSVEGCHNYREQHGIKNSLYCYEHTCRHGECTKKRVSNSEYCSAHTCGGGKHGCYNEVPGANAECELCKGLAKIKAESKTTSSTSKTTTSSKTTYSSSSKKKKVEMPDCDDYEDYDDFMDDWDGCMPDGSDAEDYWENW